ncbi:unnamed protein product [Symbiodinium microadriaticum]|nr:unnamed protein product [Symbiodinium microadriaticum]
MLDARVWRGYRDRQYVSSLAAEKERYKCLLRSAITIQSGVRMALSKREVNRRKLIRYAMGISTIQRQARIFLLRKELYEKSLTLQPVQVVFSLNHEKASSKMLPWSWQVFMAPWEDEDPGAEEKPKTEKKTNFVDMFKKVGVSNWEVMAIVHCQRLARGHLARIRTTRLKKIARSAVEGMVEFSLKEVDRRKAAAITIQRHTRGYSVRRRNLIFEKRNAAMESNIDSIKSVQAFVKRFLAQAHRVLFELPAFTGYLHIGITNNVKMFAATMIQALWPIKGWFEYTATGRDTVQVEVCFLANPSFDDYKYFLKNGSTSALQLSLEELEADLASAMSTIQGNQFLRDDVGPRKASGSKAPSRLNPSKDPRSEGSKASQKPTSAQRRRPRKARQRAKGLQGSQAARRSQSLLHAQRPNTGTRMALAAKVQQTRRRRPSQAAEAHLHQRRRKSQKLGPKRRPLRSPRLPAGSLARQMRLTVQQLTKLAPRHLPGGHPSSADRASAFSGPFTLRAVVPLGVWGVTVSDSTDECVLLLFEPLVREEPTLAIFGGFKLNVKLLRHLRIPSGKT